MQLLPEQRRIWTTITQISAPRNRATFVNHNALFNYCAFGNSIRYWIKIEAPKSHHWYAREWWEVQKSCLWNIIYDSVDQWATLIVWATKSRAWVCQLGRNTREFRQTIRIGVFSEICVDEQIHKHQKVQKRSYWTKQVGSLSRERRASTYLRIDPVIKRRRLNHSSLFKGFDL